jgi:putative ABC transport system permease protein
MMRPRRRATFSEMLLRVALRDKESYQGVLGDLHEESERAAQAAADPTTPVRSGDGGRKRDAMGGRRPGPGSRPREVFSRLRYERAVLALAFTYLLDRFRRRSKGGRASRPRRGSGNNGRRPFAASVEDFLLATRLLRRRPAFALSVVATLGLGFGAAAAVLSVAYGVWLRPLPFARPDELVRIFEVKLEGDDGSVAGDTAIRPSAMDVEAARRSRLSPPLLEDLRNAEWSSLAGVAAVSAISYDWKRESDVERLTAATASRGVFEVLGLAAIEGRFFSPAPGAREVVLSEGFWQRAFGGSPDVVGTRTMMLDGESYLIVGVVADGLPYPEVDMAVWTPFDVAENDLSEGMRGARYLDVVGRLRPGATLAAARTELDAFVRSLGETHPNNSGWGATAVPLREDLVRPFLGILQLLLTGAAVFLLLACSNVAGLVAARRVRDRPEHRLRLALGASRLRVLRQEVVEMLLLGAGGAALAALLARWALAPLRRLAPADIPRIADIRLDATVMSALAAGVLLAGVLVAILGRAMAGDRGEINRLGHQATAPGSAGRSALLVVQVALTTMLLLGGGALASHFWQLARVDPGFAPDGVAVAPVVLSELAYPSDASRLQFFESVIEGLESRGHMAVVGVNPPIAGATMRFGYRAGPSAPDMTVDQHWGQYHVVSPRYFEILGVPLISGRTFDDSDRSGSAPIVIINEALARAHFEGDPVGRDMIVVGTTRQIVGVVGSVHHFGPDREPPPEMYVPLAQNPWLLGHVMIRPRDGYSPDDFREVAAAIDPRVPVPALFPYEQFVRTWFAPLRFQLTIVILLAAAGTALAVVGLYALIAYVVAGRTREIGIRVALGETSHSVFARVVGRGLVLAVAGVVLGSVAGLALRGFLQSRGIALEVADPTIVPAVAVAVVVAAFAASAWPARRAARVDPVEALRQD